MGRDGMWLVELKEVSSKDQTPVPNCTHECSLLELVVEGIKV